jgi:hypothetical protein
MNTFKYTDDARGDKESPKDCSSLKSRESFYTCPHAPFIGRRRDFYIPKTPSNLKNIPSVNMYMNVFYISYIYKPATSSHTKPGLFETTSLTWLLTDSWISPFRKSSYAATSELELQQISEFRRLPISWFCRFMTSGLHRFATLGASQVQDFRPSQVRNLRASQVRDSWASQVQGFRSPQVRDFGASQVQDSRFRKFEIPENSFHELHKTQCFEGDRFSWIPQH